MTDEPINPIPESDKTGRHIGAIVVLGVVVASAAVLLLHLFIQLRVKLHFQGAGCPALVQVNAYVGGGRRA